MLARRELSPRVSRCLVSSIRAGLVASVLVLNLSGSSMNTDLLYPPRQWDFTGVLAPLEGTGFCFFFFQTEGILERAHCPSVFGGENKSQPHF